MRIIYCDWHGVVFVCPLLCRISAWLKGEFIRIPRAAALWPVIAFRDEQAMQPWILNHERIHIAQQVELLVIGAVLLDVVEWLVARILLQKSSWEAYLWISAEQEAYAHQYNTDYLAQRKRWARLRYVFYKVNLERNAVTGEVRVQ